MKTRTPQQIISAICHVLRPLLDVSAELPASPALLLVEPELLDTDVIVDEPLLSEVDEDEDDDPDDEFDEAPEVTAGDAVEGAAVVAVGVELGGVVDVVELPLLAVDDIVGVVLPDEVDE